MIHALVIVAMTMIGISGVGLIRAMRPGGDAPLGRSQCYMDLIMQHLRSNGRQCLISTSHGE